MIRIDPLESGAARNAFADLVEKPRLAALGNDRRGAARVSALEHALQLERQLGDDGRAARKQSARRAIGRGTGSAEKIAGDQLVNVHERGCTGSAADSGGRKWCAARRPV
jgi:hypothetical protein